jgi:DNA invertase Pin-like site-specific DNA recombinase
MTKRVGLYLRVSTKNGQTVDNQRQALIEAISRRPRWVIADEFCDEGISGAKGRDTRPEFNRLLKEVVRGKIDVAAAWSVDRLGRSLQDLVGFLGELSAAGCDLYLEKQAVDTTTPAGRALFQMLGVFADDAERVIMRSRVLYSDRTAA